MKLDEKIRVCIFDEIINELCVLMLDSVKRWRKTEEFLILEKTTTSINV